MTASPPPTPKPPAETISFDFLIPILAITAATIIIPVVLYFVIKIGKLIAEGIVKRNVAVSEQGKGNTVKPEDELFAKFSDTITTLASSYVRYKEYLGVSVKLQGVDRIIPAAKRLEEKITQLGMNSETIKIMNTYYHRFQNVETILKSMEHTPNKYNRDKLDKICFHLSEKIAYDIEDINGNGGIDVRSSILSLHRVLKK